MNYDIIGDVHGHADALEALLKKLRYGNRLRACRHPDKTALFFGDLIDRGPRQLATLNIVRSMVEAGSARVVMGNHEFNAIAWATRDPRNEALHLRRRDGEKGPKNRRQHKAFLAEVSEDSPQHREWINWFWDLPLWIEEDRFRLVHACWSPHHLAMVQPFLRAGYKLTLEPLELASRKGHGLYEAMETILKGIEVSLPDDLSFQDSDGHERHSIRTRWWDPFLITYRSAYIGPAGVDIPDKPLPEQSKIPESDRPIFIGHYWLAPASPLKPLSERVTCVDYSVARGGPLVAYRFQGEAALTAAHFVAVGGSSSST